MLGGRPSADPDSIVTPRPRRRSLVRGIPGPFAPSSEATAGGTAAVRPNSFLKMLRLEALDFERVDWPALDAFADRVVFQTREWLTFVARTQRALPVVAAVRDRRGLVGYFTGLVVRRYGVRMLGSPL